MKIQADLENLNIVCQKIATQVAGKNHIIFLLSGDIAAGKTTLVKEYVKFQGLDYKVTSPTFSLLHQYGSGLFHYDLYNRDFDDLLAKGLLDMLQEEGVHFVEWGSQKLFTMLSLAYSEVCFIKIHKNKNRRIYEFSKE